MADFTVPKGCNNPNLYIIAGRPHDEDFESGYPLSGAPGNYILRILSSYDASDYVRIINICPDDSETIDPSYIVNDLNSLEKKPNVIVTLSSEVTQLILGPRFTTIRAMQGQVYDVEIAGVSYKVVPAYSPSWILEELRLASEEDKFTTAPTEFARSMWVAAAIAKGEYVDVVAQKKMDYCMSFDEFLNRYLNDGYLELDKLAYDVETTAEPIFDENLKIIGFSIAKKDQGFYVCIDALDHHMTDVERFNTFSLLKDILSDHKVIVHNSMYERPLTLQCVDYDIPYETLDDTLAMARLMLGGHAGAGLKNQAQTHCGYPDWETDKDVFLGAARTILVEIYNHFYNHEDYPDIQSMINFNSGNKWKTGFDAAIAEFKNVCYKYYTLEETDHLLDLICEKGWYYVDNEKPVPKVLPYSYIPWKIICKYGALDAIATIDIYDYYTSWMKKDSNDKVDLFKGYDIILKQMYAGYVLERNGIYWNEKTARGRQDLWEKMCTDNLKNMIRSPYLKEEMIQNNVSNYLPKILALYYPEVARSQGYDIEYDLANDNYKVKQLVDGKWKRVSRDKIWNIGISDAIRESIYEMILKDVDKFTTKDELQRLYNPSSSKENDIALKILYTQDAKIAAYLDRLATYARSVRYNLRIRDIFDETIDNDTIMACHAISAYQDEITALKENRDIKWSQKKTRISEYETLIDMNKLVILKNDRIRNMVLNKASLFDDPDGVEAFDASKLASVQLRYADIIQIQAISDTMMADEVDREYLRLADTCWNLKKLKEDYPDSWWIERGKIFKDFKSLYEVVKPHSSKLLSMIKDAEITSMKEDNIIQMYIVYQYMGIDPENSSTWTDRFQWLIDYRIYKKLLKLINAYLEGKVGRGSVYMVNKKALSLGDKCVLRGRWFDPYPPNEDDYLLAPHWSVATAETLRWQSGMHVIPWGSPIKKFYTSRFKGGTMLAPDYSQMEVRALGGSSKDPNMLDAFARGLDFHRNTAALAFRKPPEEVTDAERRFMKMASFSILYGAKVESFADNYCHGDLDHAKTIYDGFYTAYPGVKAWIEERHKEYKETGRVSTMTNMYIVIAPDGVDNYQGSASSALRKAQNYPIQSASSSIVGCVLFEVCNYLTHHNMKSKPVMFVHDSIEVDVYPYELIQIVSEFRHLLYQVPNEQYGLPSKADFSLGLSIGHEHGLELWEPNEDYTSVHMIIEGFKDELEETIDNWKEVYDVDIKRIFHKGKDAEGNKIEVDGYEEQYVSYNELFVLKRAYNENIGQNRYHGKIELVLSYPNPRVDCTRGV